MIPERIIEQVLDRTSIVDVMTDYGIRLSERRGKYRKCCCPFHGENTPSFMVDELKGTYKCYGCGESGNAISFVMKHDGLEFPAAVKVLAEKKNIKINLLTKTAPNNQAKETRIFDKAPMIRTFYFLDEAKRSKAYTTFMVNVYSFRVTGHNKHDDAPDSLAMAADFIERPVSAKVEVFRRPW